MDLESFIRDKRKDLDVEKPDEEFLWKGIANSLEQSKTKRRFLYFKSAAAIAIIMILSVSLAYYIGKSQQPKLIFVNIDPSLAKQEKEFLNQIDTYTNQIKKTSFNPNQLATNSKEIEYVDELIKHYSDDLQKNGPNPRLINSLMDLYQKKIMILSRMLNEIEKNKKDEKRNINI